MDTSTRCSDPITSPRAPNAHGASKEVARSDCFHHRRRNADAAAIVQTWSMSANSTSVPVRSASLRLAAPRRHAADGLRWSAHHGGAANPVSFVWDGDDLLNEYRSGGVSCRYDVLDGEVFGEKRDASRYLYVPDPLGSISRVFGTRGVRQAKSVAVACGRIPV